MVSGSGKPIDLALGRRRARDRQRAGDPVDRALPLPPPLAGRDLGHSRGLMREMRERGKSERGQRPFPALPAAFMPAAMASDTACNLCRLETMRRGRSAWMRASVRAASRQMPAWIAPTWRSRGARRCSQAWLCLGSGVAEGDARAAAGDADARRRAGDGACARPARMRPRRRGARDRRVVDGYEMLAAETAELSYAELRKRERPFVLPLDPEDPEPVERAAYDAAYKGVTDALTLYLWRKPAFYLTRWAARAGLAPNFVTLVGAVLCVLAFFLFWSGEYWWGVLSGFIFMVLDTVDGKLARCTGASSKWGEVFDHGIDLIHPPFWWWAWEHGLAAYGRPLEPVYATMVLWAIIGGYVAQRMIEGHFHAALRRDAHPCLAADRQPVPADHRAAQSEHGDPGRRALSGGRTPGSCWSPGGRSISLIFHAVRLAQASEKAARGAALVSWLEA